MTFAIGHDEISAALDQQGELLQRVADRGGRITEVLEEYAGNMSVDFPALASLAADHIRDAVAFDNVDSLALVVGLATKYFLLGVVVGRDHRP